VYVNCLALSSTLALLTRATSVHTILAHDELSTTTLHATTEASHGSDKGSQY
jgi:hypothetical protein